MAEHFGKQLRRKLEALERGTVERMRNNRLAWYSEEFLQEYGHFEGCTEAEIEDLKRVQKVDYIPKVYFEFLEQLGRRCGNVIFRGGCFDYACQMNGIKPVAEELVASTNETFRLPSDAYVFLMYQGVEFHFFTTADQNDDPPVYEFHEGDAYFTRTANHLSEWFRNRIDDIWGDR